MAGPVGARERVRAYGLGLPEAYEDFPWGELVLKDNKKVFVFLGGDASETPSMSVKLRESHDQALDVAGAAPTGYGLGRAGWVTVPLMSREAPTGVLCDWVEESYRVVAPRRLVTSLDGRVLPVVGGTRTGVRTVMHGL
jgi:predicted DNA-binding protein (MmcQ/YjbR family)